MDYNNLPLGLRVQTQIPLDVKEYVLNEATLKNLGSNNNLAYTYVKGLIIYCFAESTRYEWNEVPSGLENTGLLDSDFTYPNNVVAFGVTYSNKKYNFFKVNVKADGSETKITQGSGVTVSGTGTILDPYVLSSDLSSKVDKNANITAGTFPVITYDAKGLVTGGRALLASDVPILNQNTTGTASSITGTLPQTKVDNLLQDLTARELIANKQNNLNPDSTNTKYPTVTAVINAIANITSGNVTSDGTLNYLQKLTADSNLSDSIIYDDGHNVIIGPSSGYTTTTINSNTSTANLNLSSYSTDSDTTKQGFIDLSIDGNKTSLLSKYGTSSVSGEFELYAYSDISTNLTNRGKTGFILPSLDGTRGSFNVSNYSSPSDNLFQVHASGYSVFGDISSTIDYSLHKLYVSGGIFADSFIKDGGLSTQFLKADGTVDSNTYLTTGAASSTYEPIITAGTTSQYWKGNKTWATLDKTAVGLSNVDNTSDLNKPISTATQTALNLKQDLISHLEFNNTYKTIWNNGNSNISTNTSFGDNALKSNTTGFQNTANGYRALYSNTTGGFNSAFGNDALFYNTTGNSNVAFGDNSLFSNTTGYGNTGIGYYGLNSNTTGSQNTSLGYSAISSNTTGSDNIGIGLNAGIALNGGVGSNNLFNQSIFIGNFTNALANNQTNQIVIGHDATGAGSNTVTIGNTNITKTVLRGTIEGGSFKVNGGSLNQFLKADGSLDSTVYQSTSQKDQANGYAGLGSDGKIQSSQLPSIAISDTFVVNSQAAMLALSAETGDIAVRTDLNKTFILKGSSSSTLGDWQELLTPTDSVTSVFGRSGAVTANSGDYNTSQVTENTNLYFTTARARTSLSFSAGSGGYDSSTGIITIPTNTNQLTNGAGYITGISFANVSSKPTTITGYGITDAQPLDADLTAIAALTGTSGLLKKTAADTWALDTNSYLTGITSGNVTTALGFTPYNSTNPSGFITSSSLTWSNISNKPTALSQFTNDLGNYGGWITASSTNTLTNKSGNISQWTNDYGYNRWYDGWITNPGYDANTIGGSKSGFTYANNAPFNGPLAHFDTGGYGLQFNATYSGGGGQIAYRTRNGDAASWNSWREIIHGGNIGSQSVNYANTAGSLSSMNISQFTNNSGYITGYSETDTLQSVTNRGNSTSQNITAAGFFNSSDMRLKELVDYKYDASDINPITYIWKDNSDKRKKIGYSAQEVKKVLPEAVKKDGTGMFSVDYIQILVAKVHALELKLKKHGLE